MTIVALADVAEVNPRAINKPSARDCVAFVPMAELDATSATTSGGRPRPFAEVAKGYTLFRNGDLLVAKITPCFENSKIGQARLDHPVGVGSSEFHVIRPNLDLVDDRYLLHFLRQDQVRVEGERRMTGSGGQRRVPPAFLKTLSIPLPPLAEQRRVAAIFDQIDVLRAKRRQGLAHLHELRGAIFADVFDDPSQHSVHALVELADISSGLTKGRKIKGQRVRSVPYLAVANVQDGYLKLDTVKEIEATDSEITRFALRRGDLVMTEGGDPDKLGRGTIWNGELALAVHQNHIFRVRIRDEAQLLPSYLSSFITTKEARSYFLRSAKQTTGIASINMTQLKALPIHVPSVEAQHRHSKALEGLERHRQRLLADLNAQDELFRSVEQRAYTSSDKN